MTLEEVIAVMAPAAKAGKTVVRLHTPATHAYGAHREQMDEADRLGLAYERSVRACLQQRRGSGTQSRVHTAERASRSS